MSEHQTAEQDQARPEVHPADELSRQVRDAFRIDNLEQEREISGAVTALVSRALEDTTLVATDAVSAIRTIIASLDDKLSAQVNHVLHHPEFQRLEGAWRGLHYLAKESRVDQTLKIRVMSISKSELARTLEKREGADWDQTPIFRRIYTEEYSMFGGKPFGCIVGDYYFDSSPTDVRLLGNMARICAAAHTPFIAAAAPSLLGMESWQQLMDPHDLRKIVSTDSYAKWTSLRRSEDSRYIALTLPRVLARLPYGARTLPVEGFEFEEDVRSTDHQKYCWMNSAYAMAANINRAFKLYGWCTQIRGFEAGGAVANLPVHTFPTDDGGVAMKCPTEIAIDERRMGELAGLGMMPLVHRKNSDTAAFVTAQSLHEPVEYDDADATANANLSARLPYLFAVCRFAHYLKAMARDKIGSFREREDMQRYLQDWITKNYVLGNPDNAGDAEKARRPLRAAEVVVEPVEGNPGFYNASFFLRPHYQLEGLNVRLHLVSKLPSVKAGT